jgi:tetratricopeptide (TPR) repeat protein
MDEGMRTKSEDDWLFQGIANELKALHNSALGFIRRNELDKAFFLYNKALTISENVRYSEGIGMTLFCMANLMLLKKDLIQALQYAGLSREYYGKAEKPCPGCDGLIERLALQAKRRGIAYERKGQFRKARECYAACMPFMPEQDGIVLAHEIRLLEKVMNGPQRTDRADA